MYSDRIKDIYSKYNFNEKLVKKICFSIKIRSKSLEKSDVLVTNLVHKLWSEEKGKFIPISSEMGCYINYTINKLSYLVKLVAFV